MAYKWTCSYCGRDEYSAAAHEDKELIRCIYCGRKYKNPYYKKEDDNGNGEVYR